jgi:hypothetical protein
VAEVHLPKMGKSVEVAESGRVIWREGIVAPVEGVISVKEEDNEIVIEVGSGNYSFEVRSTTLA